MLGTVWHKLLEVLPGCCDVNLHECRGDLGGFELLGARSQLIGRGHLDHHYIGVAREHIDECCELRIAHLHALMIGYISTQG